MLLVKKGGGWVVKKEKVCYFGVEGFRMRSGGCRLYIFSRDSFSSEEILTCWFFNAQRLIEMVDKTIGRLSLSNTYSL